MATGTLIWPRPNKAYYESGDVSGLKVTGAAITELAPGPRGSSWRPRTNIARSIYGPSGLGTSTFCEIQVYLPFQGLVNPNSFAENLIVCAKAEIASNAVERAYYVYLNATHLGIWRQQWLPGSNGGLVVDATLASLGKTAFNPAIIKAQFDAGTIRAKYWYFDEDEPSGWSISGTNTVYPAAGECGVGWNNSNPGTVIGPMSVGIGEASPKLQGKIQGVVRVNGTPQSGRTVRAVSRERPDIFFDTTSAGDGTFTIRCLALGLTYSVFALDPLTGDFNAVIADKIVPV